MAIQYIPDQGLGAVYGSGLGKLAEGFAEAKLKDLAERKQRTDLGAALRQMVPNLPDEQYAALSSAPVPILQQYLKNIQSQQLGQQEAQLLNQYEQQRMGGFGQPQSFATSSIAPQTATATEGSLGVQAPQSAENMMPPKRPAITLPQGAVLRQGSAERIANLQAQADRDDLKRWSEQQKIKQRDEEFAYKRLFDKQDVNTKRFSNFVTNIDKKNNAAKEILPLAVRQLELLKSGKFSVGPIETLSTQGISSIIGNPEYSEYARNINKFVALGAKEQGGKGSKFMTELIQASKVNPRDPLKGQIKYWEDIAEKGFDDTIEYQAKNDVLEAHGNMYPDDFESLVQRQKNAYKKIPNDIIPADQFPDGTEAEEKGLKLRVVDGQWRPVLKKRF